MLQLIYVLAIIFLHFVRCASCAQLYDFLVHPADVPSSNGYLLADVSVNSTAIETHRSHNHDFVIISNADSRKGWCFSLHDTSAEGQRLDCFNYFRSASHFLFSEELTGELSLTLDTEHLIQSATFYPRKTPGLFLSVNKIYRLAEPQPRLRLDGRTDPAGVDVPLKQEKNAKNLKSEDFQNKDENRKDADDMKEFQEIVKPRGLYSDDKTFIEKYWMYIVPPMLVFFIVGNLGGQ